MTRITRNPVCSDTGKLVTLTTLPLLGILLATPMLIGFASIRHPQHFAASPVRRIDPPLARSDSHPNSSPTAAVPSGLSARSPLNSTSDSSGSVPRPTLVIANRNPDDKTDTKFNKKFNRVADDRSDEKGAASQVADDRGTRETGKPNRHTGNKTKANTENADDAAGNVEVDPAEDYKRAMALLKNHYYGETVGRARSRQLTYEAIRGMVGGLKDRFSSFLDPDEWNQMQATTEGDFEGIGAVLSRDNGRVRIVEPIETGPAALAGMKADDIIVKIEGVSMLGQDLNEVVRRIKGKRGTHVRITVQRGNRQIDLSILRARVEPPVVKHWMEDPQNKIGRILLKEFNKRSIEQMNRAFTDLQSQGMRALILDLRYNPGGLLDSAIDVVSVFVPENYKPELHNVVVYMKEGSGSEQQRRLNAVESTYSRRVPIVLLVNENSASASEIVAGALKDYGVATLIGERTYGKGRVQTLIPLQDNSALRLTTQIYFPPLHKDLNFKRDENGNRIPGTGGIMPDIQVHQSANWHPEDWSDRQNDTQLRASLDFLRARLGGATLAQATQQVSQTH